MSANKEFKISEYQFSLGLGRLTNDHGLGIPIFRRYFVNQERARGQLIDIITNSPSGTVGIVSEPLGSGKTALVSMVWDDLVKKRILKPYEIKRINTTSLPEDISFDDLIKKSWGELRPKARPKVLFLEEFDRKYPLKDLHRKIDTANRFLGTDIPIMIFTGDYSLRNPDLIKRINSPYDPHLIEMDPLTPETLKQTLRLRLQDTSIGSNARKIDMDYLFDPAFMSYFLPNTDPAVANTRTTLVLIQELADSMGWSQQPAQFNADLYREYIAQRERQLGSKENHRHVWQIDKYQGNRQLLVTRVHELIRQTYDPNKLFKPLSTADLVNLLGIDIPNLDEFLDPLIDTRFLVPFGIPYYNGQGKTPEPYLPGQQTFIEAKFGPTYSSNLSLEEKIRLENAKKLELLLNLYLEKNIDKETFLRKKAELE